MLHRLPEVFVTEDRSLQVHVESVDAGRVLDKHPCSLEPPVANRFEGVFLVPGPRRILGDHVEFPETQIVQGPLGLDHTQSDLVEVVLPDEIPFLVSPPVIDTLEGHGLTPRHIGNHVRTDRNLELVRGSAYPVLIEDYSMGGCRPEPGIIG